MKTLKNYLQSLNQGFRSLILDTIVEIRHALENITCVDRVCATIDLLGSVSSALCIVIENISATKHFTVITNSVTVCYRLVRYYLNNYGKIWGCAISATEGVKETLRFIIRNKK